MSRFALPIFAAFLLLGCAQHPRIPTKVEHDAILTEVHQEFLGLADAFRALDADAYIEFFDGARFTGLSSDGTVWHTLFDLQLLIQHGFGLTEKVELLEFPVVRITVIDSSTAVLVNEYQQVSLLKNGRRSTSAGGGTQVWSKLSGSWKLVSVSSSDKLPQ